MLQSGDLIGCTSKGFVSGVINLGTLAPPYPLPCAGISHVGVVCLYHNEPLVYESTSFKRPECALQGRRVSGVQAHRMTDFLKMGGDRIWHYPLRRPLYDHEENRLQVNLDRSLGMPYDLVSAVRSGGFAFRLIQSLLRPEDLSSVFCSEFVAHVYSRVGIMQTAHVGKWSPNRLARYLVRNGICEKPVSLNP